MEQLCQYIATIILQDENEIREFHKARAQQQYSKQLLDNQALNNLPEKEFSNILKHAMSEVNFTPIRDAAIARLDQGQLTVQDLYLLLVQSEDQEIQFKVLDVLKNQVQDAPSIIAMAINQEGTWEDFDYVEGNQTSPFFYWAEVNIAGQLYTTTHPAEDPKKQRSRHLACLMWLEAFVNGELVAPEQREIPKPPVVEITEKEPVVVPSKKEIKSNLNRAIAISASLQSQ